ncbi:hypothetical protein [Streptomyces sp. NPDC058475]|uniref:hypothetical protein n=1 Tax=Streptomyces sp. NPDC058475 TaxID=3346518 RepID=UPI0036614881
MAPFVQVPARALHASECRVLQLARQPYHRWLERPVTNAVLEEAYRTNALFDAHREDPEFGYRFLADEARGAGSVMADRTAWRICRDNRWWSVFGKRRGRIEKAGPPVHDDLVRRDFTADGPNRLWLADITEHATAWITVVVATIEATRRPVKQPGARTGYPISVPSVAAR